MTITPKTLKSVRKQHSKHALTKKRGLICFPIFNDRSKIDLRIRYLTLLAKSEVACSPNFVHNDGRHELERSQTRRQPQVQNGYSNTHLARMTQPLVFLNTPPCQTSQPDSNRNVSSQPETYDTTASTSQSLCIVCICSRSSTTFVTEATV